MEDCVYTVSVQVIEQLISFGLCSSDEIEEVEALDAVGGHRGQGNVSGCLEGGEFLLIVFPDSFSAGLDLLKFLKLGKKESSKDVSEGVAGAFGNPCIFVDLTPEKQSPIGALIPNDLSHVDQLGLV